MKLKLQPQRRRYCLRISYTLYKERESGEMRMGIRMRMKVGYAEDVVEELA